MTYDWPKSVQLRKCDAALFMPPAMIDETNWDILLSLHHDPRCELTLAKLASLASVTQADLGQHLAALEREWLVTGVTYRATGELRAMLTAQGRAAIDRYLTATSDLQGTTHH